MTGTVERPTDGTVTTDPTPRETPWRAAGAAWGHAAADWAFLFEPYARDAIETVFSHAAVGSGTRLLDVACGSGMALGRAERLGADVAGIDASDALLAIAARRAPTAELVLGSMFGLPWGDASFDVVTSFNGIWGGCDDAVAEMARVLRPGGIAAFTFWGPGRSLDLRGYFKLLGGSTPEVRDELIDTARIGDPGEAERMLDAAGFDLVTRGTTMARFEWADAGIAWRALRSPGIVPPALEAVGEEELRQRALEVIAPFRAPDGSYVLANELVHVVGRRHG
ncbi:MAG TPA: methyltransferase domain-containing protein [Euzebyales bacterium]